MNWLFPSFLACFPSSRNSQLPKESLEREGSNAKIASFLPCFVPFFQTFTDARCLERKDSNVGNISFLLCFPSFLPCFLPFLPDMHGCSKSVWWGRVAMSLFIPSFFASFYSSRLERIPRCLERKDSIVGNMFFLPCFLSFLPDMHRCLKNVWWERVAMLGLFPSFFASFPSSRHAGIFGCLKYSGKVLNNWRGIYGNWIIAEISVYYVSKKCNQSWVLKNGLSLCLVQICSAPSCKLYGLIIKHFKKIF